MTLFIFIAIMVGAVIAFIYLHDKNAYKSYGQIQQEAAEVAVKSDTDLLKEVEDIKPRMEAFIQAGLVGDQFTIDAINAGSYNGPLPQKRSDGGWLSIYDNLRILKIAGINRRPDICRYVGRVECALVPEPDNEYDPDAIKIVADDRHHLGYIPAGYSDMVCSWTANEYPYRCTAFIEQHEDDMDGHQFYTGHVYIKRLD